MENIQRDLEKELAAVSLPKASRKSKRWTLLFIGDHGKVFSIKRFKGLAILWIFLLLVSIFIAAGFYYLYQNTHQANTKLSFSLENSQQVLISLRNEKDILMARLVVAESRLAALQVKTKRRQAEAVSDNLIAGSSPVERKQAGTVVKKSPPLFVNQKKQRTDTKGVVVSTMATPVSTSVAIENFEVYYEPATQTYRAKFKLKNVNPSSTPISGYTAVVLKEGALSQDKWITLPTIKLVAGKPFGYKRGQYFSIVRFKTVKFKIINPSDPKQFDKATVFVFDAQKKLLLEKDFQIRIDNISPSANG